MITIPTPIKASIDEAFLFLPPKMDTLSARIQLYATGFQESKFEHRWQVIDLKQPERKGPARGFWQFERGGGCRGVVEHRASADLMRGLCERRGVAFNAAAIWNAIEHDDVLAAGAARLLYFTDPAKLPPPADEEGAWALYLRTWRPGAAQRQYDELRAKWSSNHAAARIAAGVA